MQGAAVDLLQAVTLFIVALTLLVYGGQFVEMRRTRQSQNFLHLIDFLQKDETRKARTALMKLHGRPLASWSEEDRSNASTAISTYDVAAILIRTKAVSRDPIEQDWGNSIVRCYESAREFLDEVHAEPGNDRYWDDFEKLAQRIKRRFPDTGFPSRALVSPLRTPGASLTSGPTS